MRPYLRPTGDARLRASAWPSSACSAPALPNLTTVPRVPSYRETPGVRSVWSAEPSIVVSDGLISSLLR